MSLFIRLLYDFCFYLTLDDFNITPDTILLLCKDLDLDLDCYVTIFYIFRDYTNLRFTCDFY